MSKTTKAAAWPVRIRAFNLVEMPVVISIISLLIRLILPALGRARLMAEQTVCQTRLRQWGLAFEAYAVENDGFYPHIDGRDRTADNPQTDAERADFFSVGSMCSHL